MYFLKYRLQKIWLDKYLKSPFQKTIRMTTRQTGRKTVAICMTASLQYLLITVKVLALKEVSFSDSQNPKTVC